MITETNRAYIVWQNRAFRFYVPARCLYRRGYFSAAAYCAIQAIELLLKATLMYWDRSFKPKDGGHGITAMIRSVRNKVRGAKHFNVPIYFFHEQRYQSTSRYPTGSRGLGIPGSFLSDLDAVFADLVLLVPFQFNSELSHSLSGRDKSALLDLRYRNAQMRRLRAHVWPRVSSNKSLNGDVAKATDGY